MKMKNIIWINSIVIGIAAALFFTASVQAQEIENTAWNDSANVSANVQPSPSPAPAPTANNSSSFATDNLAISASALISGPTAKQDANTSQWATVQLWLLVSLLAGIAMVAIYALADARRANRNIAARMSTINPRPTLF